MKNKRRLATVCGGFAVLFWSLAAPTVAAAEGVNPFLFAALAHGVGFCLFACRWMILRENPLPELKKVPGWFFLAALASIVTHELTWVSSVQQAPPLEATLIIYLWPLLVVVFTTLFLKERLDARHIAGVALGFGGIIVMMIGRGLDLLHFVPAPGHLLALVCALSGALFLAFSARYKYLSNNLFSVVFLSSSIINACIWFFALSAPPAPVHSVMIVVIAGVFIMSGYMLWDYGIKNGNSRLVTLFSFLTPVLATFHLVVLGKAALSIYMAVALAMVVAGIFVARRKEVLAG